MLKSLPPTRQHTNWLRATFSYVKQCPSQALLKRVGGRYLGAASPIPVDTRRLSRVSKNSIV